MADEKKGSLLLRPRFLIFCIYVLCYISVRSSGEIMHQTVMVRDGYTVTNDHIVGSSPIVPRWRRQAYRIGFSPLMVGEEEGRRLLSLSGGIFNRLGDYWRDVSPD